VNCRIPRTIEFLNASCARGLLVEGTSAWASRQKTLPTHHWARTWYLAPHALWYGGLKLGLPAYRVEHLHVVGDISCSRCSVSARSQLLGLEDPFKTVAPRCSDRDPRSDGITR
jgi:hypothetical protein